MYIPLVPIRFNTAQVGQRHRHAGGQATQPARGSAHLGALRQGQCGGAAARHGEPRGRSYINISISYNLMYYTDNQLYIVYSVKSERLMTSSWIVYWIMILWV